ncbi:uncharacterized protein MELLADRAFT_96032 [Melampsora larici-populina 98AG31]|uniref:Uncharacterized protein n=1 Tax=Melampsora larici-populina (strain 98AG31 / pathotype 3-4-7) TaxID=747676 RepID=F4SAN3_MELLP|nr:uncharacterized protein MELLADRAFT_96032 [Melampsora larici-populina 98AG31]EGF98306.1 hypothetical protein MELLADRAFT_96032 [Melampsora larici-populina 98AG31]
MGNLLIKSRTSIKGFLIVSTWLFLFHCLLNSSSNHHSSITSILTLLETSLSDHISPPRPIQTKLKVEPPKGTTEWFKIVMNDVVLSVDESDELMHSLKSFRTIISDELIRKTIDLCKMPKIPTYSLLNKSQY